MKHRYYVGIDSTDSPNGGCTTWTAIRVMNDLYDIDPNIIFIGTPRLIRLNPNTPMKTRGNAALNINFYSDLEFEKIKNTIVFRVNKDFTEYSVDDNKSPGVAILIDTAPSNELYQQAIQSIVTLEDAIELQPVNYLWPNNSIGLIGALSAISADLSYDHTYELIAYRQAENFGKKRRIDLENLKLLDSKYTSTFSSIDENRELIAPSGPDPIFCGIRAENPKALINYFDEFNNLEQIDFTQIFITNQATDAHVRRRSTKLKPYNVISTDVTVHRINKIQKGGFLQLEIRIKDKIVNCIIFEPTKNLVKIAEKLITGDKIYIHGAVNRRNDEISIALEFFEIIHLAKKIVTRAPECCEKTMTSAGFLAGYKCKKCNSTSFCSIKTELERELFLGEKVYAAFSSQRHLTRPLKRLMIRNEL